MVTNALQEQKFKYENLKTLAKIFEKDFFLITFDLKSGYHQIYLKIKRRQQVFSICFSSLD